METKKFQTPCPQEADLAPFLSEQAVRVHTELICRKLAADLNLLLDGYPALRATDARLLSLRAHSLPRLIRDEVRYAAGGLAAHEAFFSRLTKGGGQLPDARCTEALRHSFGSTDSFFYIFREEAHRMRAGGFLWLCTEQHAHHRILRLLPLPGYELPAASLIPVFALDLWEHAYLPGYGGDRRAYADAFLRQLDWAEIGKSL